MARIVLGSYMARYPLGGMMSWVLQYLAGFRALGHDVHFVERADYPDACFDPRDGTMTDDGAYGAEVLGRLLATVGLERHWTFLDYAGTWHGTGRGELERAFAAADVFVDMGTHGAWDREAQAAQLRVLVDGEPGFTQAKMERAEADGTRPPSYDAYFTTGRNVGTPASDAPTAGRDWRPIFHPVDTSLFAPSPPVAAGLFTTVMNWRSHERFEWGGRLYGHKDLELPRFADLPGKVSVPLEAAIAGPAPREDLLARGWRVRDAHAQTTSFEAFRDYVRGSAGEFAVCKQAFVVARTGWFSDRSAAYLASGRPVVLQETGFSAHLPTGEGLFAVGDADEAAEALERIAAEPERHGRAARAIAEEHLDARRVLAGFLGDLGVA